MTFLSKTISSLWTWLSQAYPFRSELKQKLQVSFGFGIFIYLFLLFFQPFGLANLDTNKELIILGFATITLLAMLFNYIMAPIILPRFFEPDAWTIGKNILFVLWGILLIAVLNYVFTFFLSGESIGFLTLLNFIFVTASIGVFPITMLVFLIELYLRDKHEKEAFQLSGKLATMDRSSSAESAPSISLIGESKNDRLDVEKPDLLFIQAIDNYCEVHFMQNAALTTRLLRTSLKNLETQLEHEKYLIRCHRSYIVNKSKIIKLTGNARAYYLHLIDLDQPIPVSRSFDKDSLLE